MDEMDNFSSKYSLYAYIPVSDFFLLLFINHVCLFSTGFWFDYGLVIYYAVDESITFHHSVVGF